MKTPIFALTTLLLLVASTSLQATSRDSKGDTNISDCVSNGKTSKGFLDRCVGIIYAGGISGLKNDAGKSTKDPTDKAYSCTKSSPANLDWNDCKKSIGYYNAIILSEGGMRIATQVQTTSKNKKIQEEVTQKAAAGSIQTAAIEGQKSKLENDAKVLNTQMVFYGGQAASLGMLAKSWPSSMDRVAKYCEEGIKTGSSYIQEKLTNLTVTDPEANDSVHTFGKTPFKVEAGTGKVTFQPVTAANCADVITATLNEDDLFPNKTAKATVIAKALEATGKAAAAGIDAAKAKAAAKQLEQVAGQLNNTDNSSPAIIELCRVEPTNPRCVTSGTRTDLATYQPGQFNMGGGGSGQAFNPNPEASDGILGNEGVATDGKTIADITSPFSDEADKASKMLDQAGGATYGPGGGSGGGGVGGGGGGGGSASLGSDLKGVDKDNKEAEIDVKKTVASYGGGGGGAGYKAMGGSDKDENPLQSLFDGEGAKGGIEEDRSIASEGIDDKNSALFEKISKKYEKVAGEKRIEANNVE